MKLVLALY
ncbi:Protein of unknown function [Bacillus wiedmannii]|nr:Protein of unknown function [Bacillus wiedmannii]